MWCDLLKLHGTPKLTNRKKISRCPVHEETGAILITIPQKEPWLLAAHRWKHLDDCPLSHGTPNCFSLRGRCERLA
eukprot:6491470-Amphidinium_carterae.1